LYLKIEEGAGERFHLYSAILEVGCRGGGAVAERGRKIGRGSGSISYNRREGRETGANNGMSEEWGRRTVLLQ